MSFLLSCGHSYIKGEGGYYIAPPPLFFCVCVCGCVSTAESWQIVQFMSSNSKWDSGDNVDSLVTPD